MIFLYILAMSASPVKIIDELSHYPTNQLFPWKAMANWAKHDYAICHDSGILIIEHGCSTMTNKYFIWRVIIKKNGYGCVICIIFLYWIIWDDWNQSYIHCWLMLNKQCNWFGINTSSYDDNFVSMLTKIMRSLYEETTSLSLAAMSFK